MHFKPLTLAALVACLVAPSSCIWEGDVLKPMDAGADGGAADAGVDGGACEEDGGAPSPVRVFVGVEQSGRMCVLDPPGAQQTSGTPCELVATTAVLPPSNTPRRVSAALTLLDALDGGDDRVQLLSWDREVRLATAGPVAPTDPLLRVRLASMPSEVGAANDLQKGLGQLRDALERELLATPADVRARSSYVVVIVSSGVPFPRCAADDNLSSRATPQSPGGTWADDPIAPRILNGQYFDCYDGQLAGSDWCTNLGWNSQLDGGGPSIDGGVPLDSVCENVPWLAGQDYNQTPQLTAIVDEMVALGVSHGAGSVRVHTVLDFDQAQVDACGALCAYLFFPWNKGEVRPAARALLLELAAHGNGVLVDPPDLAAIDVSGLPGLRPPGRCP